MAAAQVRSKLRDRRDPSRRLQELARPKELRTIWITCPGPRVQWGTQETLRPLRIPDGPADTPPRILQLARPKPNHNPDSHRDGFKYSSGRPSAIWTVSRAAALARASDRLKQLAKQKALPEDYTENRANYVFSCGRPSPIWRVTSGSRSYQTTEYMEELSRPKVLPVDYSPPRGGMTVIPPGALTMQASDRLQSLAVSRERSEAAYRDSVWEVSEAARNASATSRCLELALPKPLPDTYLPAKEAAWAVSRAACRATGSNRLTELSKPIVRETMDHLQFSPLAFLVKETALKGRCTPRLNDLAQPLAR